LYFRSTHIICSLFSHVHSLEIYFQFHIIIHAHRVARFKKRRRRGVDYGEEIPFEKQPPAGFYDVAEDEDYASQPNFRRLRQQDVVGERRDIAERVRV
jgi:hypothetical protein